MPDGSSPPPAPFTKSWFRIGEAAKLVGVAPHVLRFWGDSFPKLRPAKSRKGQRVYSRRDVELLVRIRQLLYVEGYTIEGARKRLRATGAECCPHCGKVIGEANGKQET
jgi:DNA-binding transcriptional MerR regulator